MPKRGAGRGQIVVVVDHASGRFRVDRCEARDVHGEADPAKVLMNEVSDKVEGILGVAVVLPHQILF